MLLPDATKTDDGADVAAPVRVSISQVAAPPARSEVIKTYGPATSRTVTPKFGNHRTTTVCFVATLCQVMLVPLRQA